MRVLIISNSDLAGGANRAAFRIHQALRGFGVESVMAVRRKHSSDPYVYRMRACEMGWPPLGRGYLDMLPSLLWERKDEAISLGLQSANLARLIARFNPDVVNLHWINSGIASIRATGRLRVPSVWTMHDMWPFTGGCHYSGACLQYRQSCRYCPKIKDVFGAPAIAGWIHTRKRNHWGDKTLHAITPSAWMRELALSSSLFAEGDITHIRNCVDPSTFNGKDRDKMRAELGLGPTNKVVLFSAASQPRKGAFVIPEAIKHLRNTCSGRDWRFLFMGGMPPSLELGQDIITLPNTTDEVRIAGYYAASDVYALPSLEDNLPNTVSESLNCGTPVAAFPTGGIVEMVQNGVNGYLTLDNTSFSLSGAIRDAEQLGVLARDAIATAAQCLYAPARIAESYVEFFSVAANRQLTSSRSQCGRVS